MTLSPVKEVTGTSGFQLKEDSDSSTRGRRYGGRRRVKGLGPKKKKKFLDRIWGRRGPIGLEIENVLKSIFIVYS